MKIFSNWKELNEPRWTSIGGFGWFSYGVYLYADGWEKWILGFIPFAFAYLNYFIREIKK